MKLKAKIKGKNIILPRFPIKKLFSCHNLCKHPREKHYIYIGNGLSYFKKKYNNKRNKTGIRWSETKIRTCFTKTPNNPSSHGYKYKDERRYRDCFFLSFPSTSIFPPQPNQFSPFHLNLAFQLNQIFHPSRNP